jgi:hypothetical protein
MAKVESPAMLIVETWSIWTATLVIFAMDLSSFESKADLGAAAGDGNGESLEFS